MLSSYNYATVNTVKYVFCHISARYKVDPGVKNVEHQKIHIFINKLLHLSCFRRCAKLQQLQYAITVLYFAAILLQFLLNII